MRCSDAESRIALLAAGELPAWERWRVGWHCRGCQACSVQMLRMRRIWKALRAETMSPTPPLLRDAVCSALELGDAIVGAGAISTSDAPELVSGDYRTRASGARRCRIVVSGAALALATTCALAVLLPHRHSVGRAPAEAAGGQAGPARPLLHTLEMRLVRCEVSPRGASRETVVMDPTIETLDGGPAKAADGDDRENHSVSATMRRNNDGTIAMDIAATSYGEGGQVECSGAAKRTIRAGTLVRAMGMTSSPDGAVRHEVEQGRSVPSHAPYVAYYVDVKDVVAVAYDRDGRRPGRRIE